MVSKQATEERLEKVRKLRELKKFGKKVQQEVNIKRAKEKREMLDQVKNDNSVNQSLLCISFNWFKLKQ